MTRREKEELKAVIFEIATKVSDLAEVKTLSSSDFLNIVRSENGNTISKKASVKTFLDTARTRYPDLNGAKFMGIANPTDRSVTIPESTSSFWIAYTPGEYVNYGGFSVQGTPKIFTYDLSYGTWREDSLWGTPNGVISFGLSESSLAENTIVSSKIAVSKGNVYNFTLEVNPIGSADSCVITEYDVNDTVVKVTPVKTGNIDFTPEDSTLYVIFSVAYRSDNPSTASLSSVTLTSYIPTLVEDTYRLFWLMESKSSPESWPWDKITGKPNTLSGYGITDGVSAGNFENTLNNYYTKEQSDEKYQPSGYYLQRTDMKSITFTEGIFEEDSFIQGIIEKTVKIPVKTSQLINNSGFITENDIPETYEWSAITGIPSTLAGYGITDAYISGREIHLGNGVVTIPTTLPASDVYPWAKAAAKPSYNFSEILNTPTTLVGYGIEEANLIPAQASITNKLADKEFVNSSIATNTATFKGTVSSVAGLSGVTGMDENDYAFVVSTDSAGNTVYSRYKYVSGTGWLFEYDLNNSSFTSEQWATIQSGITSSLVEKLSGLPTNTALTAVLNGKVDKVTGKQLSTEDYTTAEKDKLAGIAAGAQVNVLEGVQLAGSDLTITNKKVNLPAYPTTLPASDVFSWAKASTKPSYTLDEIADGDTRKLSDYLPVDTGDLKTELKENQAFTSRQTADGTLDWNPSAEVIKRIKGKTLVWNQLLSNGNFINKSMWYLQRCTYTVSNNIATITVNSGETNGLIYAVMTSTVNHKYYFGCSMKASDARMCQFYVGSSQLYLSYYTQSADWERYSAICIITEQSVPFVLRNYDSSNPLLARDACVIDLTLMFGEGNEPETVEEFESMFPLPYYEYNAGTLISNAAEGLETVGFNLWDGEFSQTSAYLSNDGVVVTSGSAGSYNISSYIPVNVGKTYYLSNLSGNLTSACFYDADKTFVSGERYSNHKSLIITAPSNAAYLRLSILKESANVTCVSVSSPRNGTYEPYHKSTLPLNLNSFKVKDSNGNITTITGGLKSAGTVYDEIVGNKYIQRIGSVDLGTLTWIRGAFGSVYAFYSTSITNKADGGNVLCIKYSIDPNTLVVRMSDGTILTNPANNHNIYIRNDSYTDIASFKSAISGVILYYELTTPVEYELVDPLVFTTSVDALGTESISPVNTSIPYTTPLVADIQYGAKSGDLADNIHNSAQKESFNDIAVNNTVKVNTLTYTDNIEDVLSYGIAWTENQESSTATRIGNLNFHRTLPIQSQMKGCVYNGKDIVYYLNPEDWSLTDHAGPSRLDGTDGSIGVHIPKWYIKSGQEGTTKYVRISTINVDGTYKEVPECIIGFSRCTLDRTNLKTATIINTSEQYRGGDNRSDLDTYLANRPYRSLLGKPVTHQTRANMRKYARAAGEELLSYEMYSNLYWLYMVEYANFNCQTVFNSSLDANGYHQGGLGDGITTIPTSSRWSDYGEGAYIPMCPIGYTNSLANGTGVVSLEIPAGTYNGNVYDTLTLGANRWRGLENLFGDLWTCLDGFVAIGDDTNQSWYYYSNPEKFSDQAGNYTGSVYAGSMTGLSDSHYVLDWKMDNNGILIPSATISKNEGKCDYFRFSIVSGTYTLMVGGHAFYGSASGLGCLLSVHALSYISYAVGFRTMVLL